MRCSGIVVLVAVLGSIAGHRLLRLRVGQSCVTLGEGWVDDGGAIQRQAVNSNLEILF